MATDTTDEQPEKAESPIFVTEAGMATESSAEQSAKAR